MTDNELLLAISRVMDYKLEPIKANIKEIKEDVCELKVEMKEVKEDIQEVKEDIRGLKVEIKEVKEDIRDIKVDIENGVKKQLDLLTENYLPSAKHYESATNQVNEMKEDINILKGVVTEHSEKLQKIS